jgi:AcrR family transcriptional regulator
MIDVAAERGYRRATVREIATVAGISTRGFYQNYASKEECFLRTHLFLTRRLLRRIGESEVAACGGSTPWGAAVAVIADEWGHDPRLARFFLVAPHGAGQAALEQFRLASRSLAARLAAGFADDPASGDSRVPRLVSVGIVAGLISVARTLLLGGRGRDLLECRDDLSRWASSHQSHLVAELEGLNTAGVGARWAKPIQTSSSKPRQKGFAVPVPSDVALLHSAVEKLAAGGERDKLTVRNICAAAGVSRACFEARFANLEDCLEGVEEQYANAAWEHAFQVGETAPSGLGGVQRGLASLCNQVARDPVLANLCFGELATSGEWIARRERRHIHHLRELLAAAGSIPPSARRTVVVDAAFGAAVGLISDAVNVGRSTSIGRRGPVVGYLALAPLISSSEAIGLVSKESRPTEWAKAS